MSNNIMMVPVHIFRSVMDPRVSPLRHLAAAQRFQVMAALGTMWTTIFCLGVGAWLYYGHLLVFHLLLAFGALVTGVTFRSASRQVKTHRDYPAQDGTARYDDVWGA